MLACEEQFGPITVPLMLDLASGADAEWLDRSTTGLLDFEADVKKLMKEKPELTVEQATAEVLARDGPPQEPPAE